MKRKPPRSRKQPKTKKTGRKPRLPKAAVSIIDAINDAIVIFDRNGTVVSINPIFEKRTGLKKTTVVGKNGESLIEKTIKREDLKKVLSAFANAKKGLAVQPVFATSVNPTGRETPIYFATSYLRDQDRNPTHIIVTIKDISEITEELTEHRRHLKKLVEARTAEIRSVNVKLRREIKERRRAEKNLKIARADLMKTIRQRTSQLEKANQVLHTRILKHREAEEALRRAELTTRSVFDSIGEGVTVTNLNGTIVQVNQAAVRNSGHRSRRELVGRNAFEFLRGHDHRLIRKKGEKALATASSQVFEHVILNRDGHELAAESNVTLLRDRRGDPSGFIIVTRRIARTGSRKRKTPKTDTFFALAELLPQAVFEVNRQGAITYANRHAFKVFRYGREDIEQGTGAIQMVVPEDRERIGRNVQKILRGETVSGEEYTALRKDGSTFPVVIYSAPIVENGQPVGLRGILVDITERKRAEEKLKKAREDLEERVTERTAELESANEQLRTEIDARKRVEQLLKDVEREKAVILDSMSELVTYQDPEMRIIWANRAACESVDLTPGEITGRYCYKIWQFREDPCPGCPVKKARETGTAQEAEMTSPDGRVWDVRSYPVINAHGTLEGVVEVTADITERKRVEELIRKQHELGIALGSAPSLPAVIRLCLDTALELSGMDCGGIYLVDEPTGTLDLLHHRGFHLDEFASQVSRYPRETPQARIVAEGAPVYADHRDLNLPQYDIRIREGLRAIAVIPIKHKGNVIACLNVASHTLDEVPLSSRQALETISAFIGSGISRVRTENPGPKGETP